jgi:hypothetical protein
MNKEAALARLSALEDEARKLRTIIEAPTSLLPEGAELVAAQFHLPGNESSLPLFNALQMLIELRAQPDTVAPANNDNNGKPQFVIELSYVSDCNEWRLRVGKYITAGTKLSRISPSFASEAAAYAAMNKLGEKRLLSMFFTLHGFTPNA